MMYEMIEHENKTRVLCYIVRSQDCTMHYHREYEFVYMLTGKAHFVLNGRTHTLKHSDIFVTESNVLHSVYSDDPTNMLLVLQINPDFFNEFCPELADIHLSRHFLTDPDEAIHQAFRRCFAKMVDCYQSYSPSRSFHLLQISSEILILMIENLLQERPKNSASSKAVDLNFRLSRILKYIDNHVSGNISLQRIAEHEGLSLHYLSHFLRDRLGMTFQEYVTSLRLRNAMHMMLNTDKNLTTISQECGFSDSRYLKRAFETEYGESLSVFMKKRHDPIDTFCAPLTVGSCNPVSISIDEVLRLVDV